MTIESSLIEGLGDEVLIVLGTLTLGLLVSIAWWSTAVRERPRIETFLIQSAHPNNLLDATTNQTDNGGITYSGQDEDPQTEEEELSGGDDIAGASTGGDSGGDGEAAGEDPAATVTIKLQYLQENQRREVRTSLSEKLGRFRKRNFATELAANKTIRLIFQGHVMNGDSHPLSHYGLFDNCVVHCIILSRPDFQQANQVPAATAGYRNSALSGPPRPGFPHDDDSLDLSQICYPLLGSVLAIIWWCQLVYPHYFTVTSSASLVSITLLFLASMVNTYVY